MSYPSRAAPEAVISSVGQSAERLSRDKEVNRWNLYFDGPLAN